LGKRLQPDEEEKNENEDMNGAVDKRKNLGGGQAQQVPAQPPFNGG